MASLDAKIQARFEELIAQGQSVMATYQSNIGPGFIGTPSVDAVAASQWGISCLNLLRRVFGKDSDHYQFFQTSYQNIGRASEACEAFGILKGADDDYKNGYLFDTRRLIEAEVFDDFLEQATHLLDGGYDGPAAVLCGCVLEDGLRKLCTQKGLALPPRPKLEGMNAELAKAGAYDLLVQKRITMLSDLRNKAAHGLWSEFTSSDVLQMIQQVRMLMEKFFS